MQDTECRQHRLRSTGRTNLVPPTTSHHPSQARPATGSMAESIRWKSPTDLLAVASVEAVEFARSRLVESRELLSPSASATPNDLIQREQCESARQWLRCPKKNEAFPSPPKTGLIEIKDVTLPLQSSLSSRLDLTLDDSYRKGSASSPRLVFTSLSRNGKRGGEVTLSELVSLQALVAARYLSPRVPSFRSISLDASFTHLKGDLNRGRHEKPPNRRDSFVAVSQ
jgi:hypothetical protein